MYVYVQAGIRSDPSGQRKKKRLYVACISHVSLPATLPLYACDAYHKEDVLGIDQPRFHTLVLPEM